MDPKLLRRSRFQLRPVLKHSLEYVQLRNSIDRQGILQPLLILPTNELADGAHRLECSLDLKLADVPVFVRDLTDEQVLAAQVAANIQRVQTVNSELAKRLWEISKLLPVEKVAASFGKSQSWVRQVCSFERLSLEARKALDARKITFRQAVLLAKLPRKHQRECLGLDEQQLLYVVRQYFAEKTIPRELPEVNPSFRPIRKILKELETPTEAGRVILNETNQSPMEVWRAALRWATQMDKETLNRRKILFDKRNPE